MQTVEWKGTGKGTGALPGGRPVQTTAGTKGKNISVLWFETLTNVFNLEFELRRARASRWILDPFVAQSPFCWHACVPFFKENGSEENLPQDKLNVRWLKNTAGVKRGSDLQKSPIVFTWNRQWRLVPKMKIWSLAMKTPPSSEWQGFHRH